MLSVQQARPCFIPVIQSLADEEHAGEVENYVYLNKSESDKVKREKTDQELALHV